MARSMDDPIYAFQLMSVSNEFDYFVRFGQRKSLLGQLESRRLDRDQQVKDWSDLREKTYDALTRAEGREAFEMHHEPDEIRNRYGMHPLGQNLLLARRMVESGVRFVTVNGWAGQAEHDKKGPPSSSWDMHGGNMGMGNAFGKHAVLVCVSRHCICRVGAHDMCCVCTDDAC